MRHFGILTCILYLLAAAPSLRAQSTNTNASTVNVTVYVNPETFNALQTEVRRLSESINYFSIENVRQNAENNGVLKQYLQSEHVILSAMSETMSGIGRSHAEYLIYAKQLSDHIGNIDLEFKKMTPIWTDVRMYLAGFVQKSGEMTTSMQNLTASMNNVGSTVSSAVALAGVNTANQFITTMGPKLDAIRNALMSNGMGTNNISITSTNGDITVTNDIKITIPSMEKLNEFADKSMNKGDLVDGYTKLVPDDYWEGRQAAEWASPWQWLSLPMPPSVTVGGVAGNFMTIVVPNGSGGSWTWDANPMTHMPGVVNGFRTGMIWATLLGLLFFCGKVAQENTLNMGAANQTHSPNIAVLGSNTGLGIGLLYVALFVVAAGAFATVMGNVIDTALFTELALNPFRDFSGDVMVLANMFFPLGLMVSSAIWSLTARWLLLAEAWIFNFVIRSLPA